MLRGRTRVLSACQRCRKQKIKCSGTHPCRTCHGRGLSCDFGAEEKQVQVSERELFELKQQVRQLEGLLQTSASGDTQQHSIAVDDVRSSRAGHGHKRRHGPLHATGFSSQYNSPPANVSVPMDLPNPLVPDRPVYISEESGRIRWLGPSSTYAFTQKVLHIVQQSPPANPAPEILLSNDGHTYKAESNRLMPVPMPDVSNLPSKDTAMYYLECVKFRTNPLLYLFDDIAFKSALQQFYSNPIAYATSDIIWFIHFLVLIALGKSLDPHSQFGGQLTNTVSEHFTRALQLLPDMTYCCYHNVKTTELFCSIALYLQSIDHRQAALLYISQAVRFAQLYALHLDLEENVVGSPDMIRGRRLWWTVYTLDRKLTLSQGIPNMIDDRDIRNPWPVASMSDDDSTAMAIHLKICRLLGKLISRVYGSSGGPQKSFIATTQAVLSGAAHVNEELKTYTKRCFGEISRVVGHLELAYHHCIMLACRPALYSLLRLRFETNQRPQPTALTPSMTGLLQACIDSAVQSVQTLSQLKKFGLLDTFFPFDLECAFSAAFVLIMADYVHPKATPKNDSIARAKEIIELIADRGSVHAGQRKVEVEQLADQLTNTAMNARAAAAPGEAMAAQMPQFATSTDVQQQEMQQQQRQYRYDPMFGSPFFDEWNFDTGLTADQIMNLADALETEDIPSLEY